MQSVQSTVDIETFSAPALTMQTRRLRHFEYAQPFVISALAGRFAEVTMNAACLAARLASSHHTLFAFLSFGENALEENG
ncbi:hypothetical protein [uncultured Sphingorhabdus sp.]|uniref:hypothetical protein n=1 Tax=uncultured Sphingorhabdus sp. TaxID=1686106 RepID=UPI00262F8619|nr:hypothetical protein [uncultured Sphingorhabdus sp.]HMS20072.1 hypothetical protein [Sphingorhabdus sp.]